MIRLVMNLGDVEISAARGPVGGTRRRAPALALPERIGTFDPAVRLRALIGLDAGPALRLVGG